MGCASGKLGKRDDPGKDIIPEVRRRLSLDIVDQQDEDEKDAEEARSLVMQLTGEQLMNLVGEVFGSERKYSIGSETDQEGHRKDSFAQKTVKLHGDAVAVDSEGLGYACKKGLKPEAPNQDSFFVVKVEGHFSIYGVFDGHGRKGHDVSNFVKDQLPKILIAQPDVETDTPNAMKMSFKQTQRLIEQATKMQKIDALKSGSTASVVLHHHKTNTLFVSHVGDSRVVLGKRASNGAAWVTRDLTEDHKPNNPEEKARIEKNGGQVRFDGHFNYRMYAKGKKYPGLNMSRAMGDLMGYYDAGLSSDPDVQVVPLGKKKEAGGTDIPGYTEPSLLPSVSSVSLDPDADHILLLCSDGIWEFMTSDEAVQIAAKYAPGDAMSAAEDLACGSWDRWMDQMQGQVVDDITALVVRLDSTVNYQSANGQAVLE